MRAASSNIACFYIFFGSLYAWRNGENDNNYTTQYENVSTASDNMLLIMIMILKNVLPFLLLLLFLLNQYNLIWFIEGLFNTRFLGNHKLKFTFNNSLMYHFYTLFMFYNRLLCCFFQFSIFNQLHPLFYFIYFFV